MSPYSLEVIEIFCGPALPTIVALKQRPSFVLMVTFLLLAVFMEFYGYVYVWLLTFGCVLLFQYKGGDLGIVYPESLEVVLKVFL